jgi:peptidoglycan/xylan/chitin deacetylase (PgdA/CDA1 family)
MTMAVPARALAIVALWAVTGLAACTLVRTPTTTPPPTTVAPQPSVAPPAPPAPAIAAPAEIPVEPLPDRFESKDFIVTFARAGDTAASLAARHLGDPAKAWLVEDYTGTRAFESGQEVVIPRRDLNPVGVVPTGYQLVPVLVYHNIGPERRGRLLLAARTFEEQMRSLHAEGYRTIGVGDLLAFVRGGRQLPRRAVLLAFDDGYRSFLEHARPVLKELGLTATLFVYTDFLGGGSALGWRDLQQLLADGFDVQAHSKTHGDLRRRGGESATDHAARLERELAVPLALFRKHLGRSSESVAYPYGAIDDEVTAQVARHGYVAGFTVRRQANPAFAAPLAIGRAQIYADMTPADFARTLTVFQDEPLHALVPDDPDPPAARPAHDGRAPTPRQRLAAPHTARAEALERQRYLRPALEARTVALTIDPGDVETAAAIVRLQQRIDRAVAGLLDEGQRLAARAMHREARQRFLAALALDPTCRPAFEALQGGIPDATFIVHTVRPGDTLATLAELYYGDHLRADVIAETNRLPVNARLVSGRSLRIPEIPGVPFLPR